MTYTLELDKDRLMVYIRGLDARAKIVGSTIAQGINGNSLIALRETAGEIQALMNEAAYIDKMTDEVEKAKDKLNSEVKETK